MKIISIDSLDYTIVEPDYNRLTGLGEDFLAFKGLDLPQEKIVGSRAFTALLMQMFKYGESEEHKGIVNDFLTLLTLLGVEYQPLMLVKKQDVIKNS